MTGSNDVAWEPQPLPEVLTEQLRSHGFQPSDSAEVARQIGEAVGPAASASLFVDLGACNFLEGDIDGAIATWRRAVSSGQVAPGARALLNLGLLYEHLHLHDRAISVLQSAVERQAEPFATEASIAEARCHCAKGDNSAGLATLARLTESLIVNQPRSGLLGLALLQMGDVARSAGRPDRAERAWKAAAVSQVPHIENAANEKLISLLVDLGRDDEARQVIDESSTSRASLTAAQRLHRAELLIELGRGANAVELLATVRGDQLDTSERFRLTDVLLSEGLINEAIDHLESLIELPLVDHQMRARYGLAEVYRSHGMVIEAEDMYQSVIDSEHRYWSPKAGLHLGDLHDERDDIEGAVGLWVRAASSPVVEVREDAEARLTDRVTSSLALARAVADDESRAGSASSAQQDLLDDLEADASDQSDTAAGHLAGVDESTAAGEGAVGEDAAGAAAEELFEHREVRTFANEILAAQDVDSIDSSTDTADHAEAAPAISESEAIGSVDGVLGAVAKNGDSALADASAELDDLASPAVALATAEQPGGEARAVPQLADDVVLDRPAETLASQDSAGQDSAGQDSAGQDSAGQDSAGQDSAGQDSAGQDSAGQDSAGQDSAEHSSDGEDSAEHDSAESADQDSADSARHDVDSADQDSVDSAGQDSVDSAGQDSVDSAGQDSADSARHDVDSADHDSVDSGDQDSAEHNSADAGARSAVVAASAAPSQQRFVAPTPTRPPTVIPLRVPSLADDVIPPATVDVGAFPAPSNEPFIVALGNAGAAGGDTSLGNTALGDTASGNTALGNTALTDPFAELAPADVHDIDADIDTRAAGPPTNPYAELSPANLVADSQQADGGELSVAPESVAPESVAPEAQSPALVDNDPGEVILGSGPVTDVPGAVPFGSPLDELRWKSERRSSERQPDDKQSSASQGFFSRQLDE